MARLYRDTYGIPHLRADSVTDLARAQGAVTVRDRAWQLEWLRRRATGTTAALVGDDGVAWDDFSRRMRTTESARRAYDACEPATQAFVASYVDGVNAALATLDPTTVPELNRLGVAPGPWEPWTPLATFLAQHLLFGSIGTRLWERLSGAVLGADARLLSHEGPFTSGSNAWAVGGARTASGVPLIGGDPHRTIEQPGVYQQVRLVCEDPDDAFDVAGFSFVGVPGVQHFAHAGEVAWAITNACADYQDLVEVTPGEPLPEDLLELQPGLAVRASYRVLGDLGFDALLPLLRARSVADVDDALDRWVEPVNNAVIADRAGAVRYRIAGRVPVRNAQGEWVGWLDDPHRADLDPVDPDGAIVTANERRGPESARIGSVFAPPYRARRIRDLLAGRSGLTAEDFVAIHDDSLLLSVPTVAALVPGAFDDFDGRMRAGSPHAARYAAWRSALVHRIAEAPELARLRHAVATHDHGPLFAPWLGVTYRVGLALPTLAAAASAGHSPLGLDLAALARDALAEVDALAATGDLPATWGETHVAAPVHALAEHGLHDPDLPAPPLDGDQDCVRAAASYPAITDACSKGSVARYVWDLADRERGGWVVPTGASGLPGPHERDQQPHWAAGTLVPIVSDWDDLTPEP
ncbi:penicillin acylase family protein [Nocardioides sp. GY 10113]|uniref:penicillin acylase family protein n=1 Tax=Nocardioides sp. GY 10113 TaxID=2569761 RepID=UPI0010A840AE|nr:penicillin acylase family protein [Nocardioides sp. GY 10113]TIC87458.1 penicillin acylase family protein [Nocardioides sp. GY 10113]